MWSDLPKGKPVELIIIRAICGRAVKTIHLLGGHFLLYLTFEGTFHLKTNIPKGQDRQTHLWFMRPLSGQLFFMGKNLSPPPPFLSGMFDVKVCELSFN